MTQDVLIESVKKPGTTKLVAPVFADILCDILGLYRRRDMAPEPAPKAPRKPRSTPKTPARPKRTYKTRRLSAEE
jgi:hypothetical protein